MVGNKTVPVLFLVFLFFLVGEKTVPLLFIVFLVVFFLVGKKTVPCFFYFVFMFFWLAIKKSRLNLFYFVFGGRENSPVFTVVIFSFVCFFLFFFQDALGLFACRKASARALAARRIALIRADRRA